jgi:DNA gyrase subunit A
MDEVQEQQTPIEEERIIIKPIQDEMKQAYINYAMAVIVGRALPCAKDGLKPVHRRILYAMYDMGMLHNKPFKKCARIVGEVLGKYHPHGDTAVYDSLVRMAQGFSLRYPLIFGQGNFGSIDGDNAAAMRYTESKLTKLAEELLRDIEKETVGFKDNFDSSLTEPTLLPSKFPNLLLNGSSGIAVGMATNIPPHNMGEVCRAIVAMIKNPDISVQELIEIVPGPDFPTGGEVYVGEELLAGYTRGRGRVIIKSVVDVDEKKLIVREIPYQVNKSDLIIQIANLVKEKRVLGIRNINDESDRDGIRVVIDLKGDADPQVVLNQLYSYSRLRTSFSLNMLALVENQPKLLGLKELLEQHILHRKNVIIKRTAFDLRKAEERLHILDGLLIALNNLDEVIPAIRQSATAEDAKNHLIEKYSLSEPQAKAILDLKLQKLASLEQNKLRSEHKDLMDLAISLREILASEKKVHDIIIEETETLSEKFDDGRRSLILQGESVTIDMEDLIEETKQVVTLTNAGYLKRLPLDTYRTQHRGGRGVSATGMKDEDFIKDVYVASTHSHLLCITDMGQLYWLKVYRIPEGSRQAKGKHIANIVELRENEHITAIVPVRNFKQGFLFMATRKGTVKKTEMSQFSKPRKGGIRAIDLAQGDSLVGVRYTPGTQEIILATRKGQANRFRESDVRAMGRSARGVRGIRLAINDEVIGLLGADNSKQILTITRKGYGKRTDIREYRLCNRGGKGVTNVKITDKNGDASEIMVVDGSEDLMLVSHNGIAIRMRTDAVSHIGRATQGVRVMRLGDDDIVVAAAKIASEDVSKATEENEEETPVSVLNDEDDVLAKVLSQKKSENKEGVDEKVEDKEEMRESK